jgi:hypothetical protein
MRRQLASRYNTVRPFLPLLGKSSVLGAATCAALTLGGGAWLAGLL